MPAPRSQASPNALVARELLRTAGQGLALPWNAAAFLAQRADLRRAFAADLERLEPPAEPAPPVLARGRAPVLFVSCAEASGEIHAVSLVRALREECQRAGGAPPRFVGLGGARLEAEGVELVGRPVERAQMGLSGVAANLGYYVGLVRDSAAALRARGCEVFVPVDSPALHVPIAHIARRLAIPTVHFVAPQYWGWAPWRVRAYRKAVQRPLTILPFEPGWYARQGVAATHVGHPLLDALAGIPETRPDPAARALVLLPGSRESVVERNLPWMLARAAELRARHAELEVVVVQAERGFEALFAREVERAGARGWARVACGDLHGELARARAAFAVSGTVLLDLLHHRLPTVVVYRLGSAREEFLGRRFLTVPWFAVVNLLANAEACPEFSFHGAGPQAAVGAALERCYNEGPARTQMLERLELARARLGPPGAARRAARAVLQALPPPHPLADAPRES